MSRPFDLTPLPPTEAQALQTLERVNALTAADGLSLTPADLRALEVSRRTALRDSGRVELGGGILPQLAQAFSGSPYLSAGDWAAALADLQELFYHFKTAARERLSDEDLLAAMRRCFDGPAGGDADYLRGLTPRELLARPDAPPEGTRWSE